MRIIVLMLVAVMMLPVASMGAVGTTNTSDVAKEKVIIGDEACEPVIIGFKERPDKTYRELSDKAYQELLVKRELLVNEHDGKVSHSYRIINALSAHIPSKAIDGLKKNPNVKYVECDYIFNTTAQQLPWGVDHIGAPIVHGYDRGSGIKVAILDTGIDYNHPDLQDNYMGGIDCVNDDNDPMDDQGHGTHCAGVVAATDNGIGVMGVAPEASLYGVKVLNSEGKGYLSDIIAGIEWSVNNDMQVISMSISGWQSTSALQEACDAANNSGVLLVASAGNSGSRWMPAGSDWDLVGYPAKYESVIAVAATDSMDERPYWSSTGASVEIAAPGVDINSTYWNDTYTTIDGTSMACPHVSGTAALILATPEDTARDANNDGTYETDGNGVWTNNEVRAILQATADDLGDTGRDNLYGFGLVNASKAAPPSGDDTLGPRTSGMSADPDPTNGADSVTLTASISDSTTGNSDVVAAEYFIDTVGADGTGTSMDAVDGAFDSATEGVTADIDVSGWAVGSYTLYVHGTDVAGNWGTIASVALEVTEASTNTMMHVDSIDMELIQLGVFYRATATVTIVDATDNPVEGATVSGHWEDATNDHDSGVTDSDGQTPPLQSDHRWSSSGTTFTFVVDDVTKEGWTYDPDANKETEDSVTVP